MIRFIDLGKQIAVDETDPDWPRQFAFFDTIYSQFIKIEGEAVFDSFVDFAEHCAIDREMTQDRIERLVGLMPDWARLIPCPNPRSSYQVFGLKGVSDES
jgi:hypothetical protein